MLTSADIFKVLELDSLEEWAKSKSPLTRIGPRRECQKCAIAHRLLEIPEITAALVQHNYIHVSFYGNTIWDLAVPTPEHIELLIKDVDASGPWRRRVPAKDPRWGDTYQPVEITVKTFLRCIAMVRGELESAGRNTAG